MRRALWSTPTAAIGGRRPVAWCRKPRRARGGLVRGTGQQRRRLKASLGWQSAVDCDVAAGEYSSGRIRHLEAAGACRRLHPVGRHALRGFHRLAGLCRGSGRAEPDASATAPSRDPPSWRRAATVTPPSTSVVRRSRPPSRCRSVCSDATPEAVSPLASADPGHGITIAGMPNPYYRRRRTADRPTQDLR